MEARSVYARMRRGLLAHSLAFSTAFLMVHSTFLTHYAHADSMSDAYADSMPENGKVQSGSAQISGGGSDHMIITQTSDKAVLHWDSFSIHQGGRVDFVQPSSQSASLNRVTGNTPSSIAGQLNSNGRLLLINPNGIAFMPGSVVNVGSLVAASLDIKDEDFHNEDWIFNGADGTDGAVVSNHGRIDVADGGFAALLGGAVSNQGVITAKLGRIGLGSGDRITLDLAGDGFLSVDISQADLSEYEDIHGNKLDALVQSNGELLAEGGLIQLSAASMKDMMRKTVHMDGKAVATSFRTQGGKIILEGGAYGSVSALGEINVSAMTAEIEAGADGGNIAIHGANIALGGTIHADGANGGLIEINAQGSLSLADQISAQGLGNDAFGNGGTISYQAGGRIMEIGGSRTNVSGTHNGGRIELASLGTSGLGTIASSGIYLADGLNGNGGRIDFSSTGDIHLFSAEFSAKGGIDGGLVRLGGSFRGGASIADDDALADIFVNRWQNGEDLESISNASSLLFNDSSKIDVSGLNGSGGTAILWSQDVTTMSGAIYANGGLNGGAVEVSSADLLRHVDLLNIEADEILLDPKNLVIGDFEAAFSWSYSAIIGFGYNQGTDDIDLSSELDVYDYFGSSVALNGNGDLLAVGAYWDDGFNNSAIDTGAVYLFEFSNSNFEGGTLSAMIGEGYAGENNIDLSSELDDYDFFGSSVAFNDAGDRLAVGAYGDDGFNNSEISTGAVYLFEFSDSNFSDGTLSAMIGEGYNQANTGREKDIGLGTKGADGFGISIALNESGNRLAVGASWHDGRVSTADKSGAVYLFEFSDGNFSDGELSAMIGEDYVGDKDINLNLDKDDRFGTSVTFNGSGNLLAVGARGDDGYNNFASDTGAVYLFKFDDGNFSGGTLSAMIGEGYAGDKDINIDLDEDDYFGVSTTFNGSGDRLAVGAYWDDGYNNLASNTGAVYLFEFDDGAFSGGTLSTMIGDGYDPNITGRAGDVNIDLDGNGLFGSSVAFNGSGNRLAVGAAEGNGFNGGANGSGAVYLFKYEAIPIDSIIYDADGEDSNLALAEIEATLESGRNLTLSASNDIVLQDALSLSEPNIGDLTLQAGRSLIFDASITSNGGTLTLIANDTLANGVSDGNRDAGDAVISMATGTFFDLASGDLIMELRDGVGKTNSQAGNIDLQAVTANNIKILNFGAEDDNQIILNQNITATQSTGTSIIFASDQFNNVANADLSLNANADFQIWSATRNHANHVENISDHDFRQYDIAYGTAGILGVGSGFLYAESPTLIGTLSGTSTKIYDGTISVTDTNNINLAFADIHAGDTYNMSNALYEYADKNVGNNLEISLNNADFTFNDSNGKPVYGYALGDVNSNIGEITPKALNTSNYIANDKIYDGNTNASLNDASLIGMVSGDDLNIAASGLFDDKNVGNGKDVTISYNLSGSDADNYSITDDIVTAAITQASLSITANDAEKIELSPDPTFTYNIEGLVANETPADVLLSGLLARDVGEAVGEYAIRQGSFAFGASSNYIMQFTNGKFTILAQILSNINSSNINSSNINARQVFNLSATDQNYLNQAISPTFLDIEFLSFSKRHALTEEIVESLSKNLRMNETQTQNKASNWLVSVASIID